MINYKKETTFYRKPAHTLTLPLYVRGLAAAEVRFEFRDRSSIVLDLFRTDIGQHLGLAWTVTSS